MKILVIGIADFSYLFQNTYEAFKFKYSQTEFFNIKKYRRITKHINKEFDIHFFRKKLYKLEPNLIFIVAPYVIKKRYYDIINEYKINHSCIVAGWIGDRFDDNHLNNYITHSLDSKFISDTYFFNFYNQQDNVTYLPLATNPNIFYSECLDKNILSSFVASSTPYREEQLSKVSFPLNIYGTGWENFKKISQNVNLDITTKKLNINHTARIYKSSITVLNLTNENNLVYGLNQRSFDPFLSNAVVLQEYCKDLELCFEPNKEIIVFNEIEELNDIFEKYKKDKNLFNGILEKGKKRVLNEHTFESRINAIISKLELS